MKITVTGWSRNAGETTIVDQPVKTVNILLPANSSNIQLDFGPVLITLGGQYKLSVTLSDSDIRRMYASLELRSPA